MNLLRANNALMASLRNFNNLPTNSFKKFTGKYKWWGDSVYTQPVVKPLQRGPDFTFQDGRSPRITHKYELDRREEHTLLAKKIVKCLSELKEAEQLNLAKKQTEELDEMTRENWTPKEKGNVEFS